MFFKDFFNWWATWNLGNSKSFVFSSVDWTVLVDCLVWILVLSCLSVVFDISQCSGSISPITAMIIIRSWSSTVDYLLFTEIDGDVCLIKLNLVALMGSSCSKGPARPTSTLISNISDHIFSSPINRLSKTCVHWFFHNFNCLSTWKLSKICWDKFIMGEVWKLIKPHFPFLIWDRVVLVHGCHILLEKLASVDELISLRDSFSKLLQVWEVVSGTMLSMRRRLNRIEYSCCCKE